METLPDMTLETIVKKTKKMLGKNYREVENITDTELNEVIENRFRSRTK